VNLEFVLRRGVLKYY